MRTVKEIENAINEALESPLTCGDSRYEEGCGGDCVLNEDVTWDNMDYDFPEGYWECEDCPRAGWQLLDRYGDGMVFV